MFETRPRPSGTARVFAAPPEYQFIFSNLSAIPDGAPWRLFPLQPHGLQRVEYWGGLNTFIFNATGTTYQLNPISPDGVHTVQQCFSTGAFPLMKLFPDLSEFTPRYGPPEDVRGVPCVRWERRQPVYDAESAMIGHYTVWTSEESGLPVRYSFLGHNTVTNSHFDNYTFEYLNIESLPKVGPSVFHPSSAWGECDQLMPTVNAPKHVPGTDDDPTSGSRQNPVQGG